MESLYFVAVVPPLDIRDQVTSFKRLAAEQFNSRHALKSPPHITLHMPFKWKDKRLDELRECLGEATKDTTPFELSLKDFDFFPPRVVFVDVVADGALNALQSSVAQEMRTLHLFNATHKDQPFHPHMTVAFRDLRKSIFPNAKAYFDGLSYEASFLVDHVVLLRHDEGRWEQFETFYFP